MRKIFTFIAIVAALALWVAPAGAASWIIGFRHTHPHPANYVDVTPNGTTPHSNSFTHGIIGGVTVTAHTYVPTYDDTRAMITQNSYGLGVDDRSRGGDPSKIDGSGHWDPNYPYQYGSESIEVSFAKAVLLTSFGLSKFGDHDDGRFRTRDTSGVWSNWFTFDDDDTVNFGGLEFITALTTPGLPTNPILGIEIAAVSAYYNSPVHEDNNYFQLAKLKGEFEPTAGTPEPGSLVLLGSGLAGLVALRRRRRRKP